MLSATTPVFTAEDEKKEIESLSPEELHEIEADVYGQSFCSTTDYQSDDDDDHHRAAKTQMIRQCEQTLQQGNSRELWNRFQSHPALSEETPLVAFLQAAGWKVPAAAKRFHVFWSLRQQVFGPDRAFLPLDEALTDDDRRHLVEDRFALPLEKDAYGRTVFLLDRVRAATVPREMVLRLMIYTGIKTFVDDGYGRDDEPLGFVLLINYVGCRDLKVHYDRRLTKLIVHCGLALPCKLKCAHLYLGTSRKTVASLILPAIRQLATKWIRRRLRTHVGPDLHRLLAPFGLNDRHHVQPLLHVEHRAPNSQWRRLLRLPENDNYNNNNA